MYSLLLLSARREEKGSLPEQHKHLKKEKKNPSGEYSRNKSFSLKNKSDKDKSHMVLLTSVIKNKINEQQKKVRSKWNRKKSKC